MVSTIFKVCLSSHEENITKSTMETPRGSPTGLNSRITSKYSPQRLKKKYVKKYNKFSGQNHVCLPVMENKRVTRWEADSQRQTDGQTDRQTDGQTDRQTKGQTDSLSIRKSIQTSVYLSPAQTIFDTQISTGCHFKTP